MEKQFVVFQIAQEHYGGDISGVREILRLPEITRMPSLPEFVEGIINPRGTVIPVIDLHTRFGLPERDNTNATRVMVLNVGKSLVGAVVDSVSEVLSIGEDEIERVDMFSVRVSAEYITGVAKLENRLVILLDYEKVLSDGEQEEVMDLVDAAAG